MRAVMNSMPLVASTVCEALRFFPPVPFQYARAKKDFIVESHDARFQIKAGEFLGGCNYMVSRDPRVFTDPDKFVAERFMGPEGEALLRHLVWSNGRQTDETGVGNKQCAAKDIVPLTGRLLLAEMMMRYDEFGVKSGPGLDMRMAFTSLQRAQLD
jgi:hydroperoxide dehydratase